MAAVSSEDTRSLRFAVVTPTYNRARLLARFVRRLRKQTYPHWTSVIVHDGPSEGFARWTCALRRAEPRLIALHTPDRSNNCGNTPRLTGARHLAEAAATPDYVVFWDDDNFFYKNALEKIARAAEALGKPDFFLVEFGYNTRVHPPEDVPFATLTGGEVDTANMVMRVPLAIAAYQEIVARGDGGGKEALLVSDWQVFDYLRARHPDAPVYRPCVIGFHDGLRLLPHIRYRLGLPPLKLRSRAWVRWLTLGRVRQRAAGGLE